MLLRVILLPVSSEGWDYRFAAICPVYAVLGIKLRVLCIKQHSEPHPQATWLLVCAKNKAEFLQQRLHSLQNLKMLIVQIRTVEFCWF